MPSPASFCILSLMEVYRLEIREALGQFEKGLISSSEYQHTLKVALGHAVSRIDAQEIEALRVVTTVAIESFYNELERQAGRSPVTKIRQDTPSHAELDSTGISSEGSAPAFT